MSRINDDDPVEHSNGNEAIEKRETRVGMGLDYVAGKQRLALVAIHRALMEMVSVPPPNTWKGCDIAWAKREVQEAFINQLVSYLALNNMLALANASDFPQRWERFTADEFKEWLDRIDENGSLNEGGQ